MGTGLEPVGRNSLPIVRGMSLTGTRGRTYVKGKRCSDTRIDAKRRENITPHRHRDATPGRYLLLVVRELPR